MAKPLLNVMQLISSLEVGGAEKLLVDLLAACQDDAHVNFTVVIMNQAVNADLKERLERLGLNVYYLNRPEGHLHPCYVVELLNIVHRHRVQIVHVHNFGSKMWAMLCKLLQPHLKLVFTIHDTMMLPRLGRLQLWLHRRCIDRHIAISKAVASLCEQHGLPRYTHIYNGIELSRYDVPNRLSLTERVIKRPFESHPLRIVCVGRMDYKVKGQDILVQALQRCKMQGIPVHCTLMGGVYTYNQQAFSELKELINTLGLQPQIEYLIGRTDVPQVLAEADLFVMPSRFEGLGLALLEAMAAGVPVIASRTDGPRELIEDGLNGFLFDSGDANHLFSKIQFAYEHPKIVDRVRQNASVFVQSFDIHRMKEGYYQIYAELLTPDSGVSKEFNHVERWMRFESISHEASI